MSFKQIFIKNKSYLSYQNNSMSVKNEFTNTLVCLDDIDIIPDYAIGKFQSKQTYYKI